MFRLATAAELPVRVNVQATAPVAVSDGVLQAEVKPLGKPEASVALLPAKLPGTVTPPNGVAVTVKEVAYMEPTVSASGDACIVICGA